jgi:hypothetical protein
MNKLIQIIIDATGQIRIETQGFAGSFCREASKRLEEALGIVESDKPTSELYQQATSQEATQQKLNG